MGGDFAPEEIVKGVAEASLATTIECVLVGDEPRIQAVLDTLSYDPAHISIHHAGEAVGMQEAPREALRAKRDASIAVGAALVARGQAEALVSAGNTGACLLACAREFRPIKGRPQAGARERLSAPRRSAGTGSAGALARRRGDGALRGGGSGAVRGDGQRLRAARLEGGASAGRPSQHGDRAVQGRRRAGRGPRAARGDCRPSNFVGNIEGNDVAKGRADVIVCEGLLGSVVLKFIEGIADVVNDVASNAVKAALRLAARHAAPVARPASGVAPHRARRSTAARRLLGFEQLLDEGARALAGARRSRTP